MKSLTTKFTLIISVTIISILAIFSFSIYFTNIRNKAVITPEQLADVPGLPMQIQRFLKETDRLFEIAGVAEAIQENEKKEYRDTVILLMIILTTSSALIAYLISKSLVAPVKELNNELKTISHENMTKRVPENYKSEEIQFLAISFNKLLDELYEAFNSQERFIQDAAHELRTPLAAIKSNIESSRSKKNITNEQYEHILNTIDILNNKIVHLNEQLLFLNRNRSKQSKIETNIVELVEEIIESLSIVASDKNVRLEFEKPSEEIFYKANPETFSRAISNLIENGIKYSKNDKAKIEVHIEKIEGKIVITIKDNGIGISKKDLNNIFERFFRADNAAYVDVGEGLGLSITKKIIEEHSGIISVKSKLNSGTTFRIEM